MFSKPIPVTFVLVSIVLLAGFFWSLHRFIDSKIVTDAKTPLASVTTDDKSTTTEVKDNTAIDLSNLEIPILMYHHIRDFSDPTDQIGINLSVSPARFASELDLIVSKGYTTINFKDLESGRALPSKPIILTFDDGYLNFFANAYPELAKRKMTAVSYIITGKVGGDYMATSQIKDISEAGIEIGSHTISHPDLSTATAAKAHTEIFQSKVQLEAVINKPIISFCYPSGKFNNAAVEIVRQAGYHFAVTTVPGVAKFNDTLRLSRHRVNADTNISTYLK